MPFPQQQSPTLRFKIRVGACVAVALGVATLGALSYWSHQRFVMNDMNKIKKTVSVVLSGQLTLPLAPENISSIPLYHVHKNLWGTLLSDQGAPSLGRLVKRSPDGRVYQFEILPTARFSDGSKITAKDVAFSFRRLIEQQPGGHFNAKSVIDKIDVTSESTLQITLRQPSAAFLFLLSIPEMGIVPSFACDKQGHILNFQVTSGAYSVVGTPEPGQIRLKKNPYFLEHALQSPEEVTLLLRRTQAELLLEMNKNHADFLEAYDSTGVEAFQNLQSNPAFSQKVTRPSYSIFVVTNPKTLTLNERKGLATLFSEKLAQIYHPIETLEQRSYQILPPGTFGSLKQVPLTSNSLTSELPKQIRLATQNPNTTLAKAVIQVLTDAGIRVEIKDMNHGLEHADLLFCGQGMNADFPEIEFQLSMISSWAYIPGAPTDRVSIDQALHTDDATIRQSAIEQVGQNILADARVIPLYVRSYAHLYRRHLNLDSMTNYDGDILLWKIQVAQP